MMGERKKKEKKKNNLTLIWWYGHRLCCWASFTLRAVLATLRAVVPHGVVLGVGSHPSMHLATRRLARRQGGTGLSGGAVRGHLRAHVHWRGAGEKPSQTQFSASSSRKTPQKKTLRYVVVFFNSGDNGNAAYVIIIGLKSVFL